MRLLTGEWLENANVARMTWLRRARRGSGVGGSIAMRAIFRILCILFVFASCVEPSAAQAQSTPEEANSSYSPNEIVEAGGGFFGGGSKRPARILEPSVRL